MSVYIKLNDNIPSKNQIDKILKKFKRKVKESGILKEVFERTYYVKPSVIKRQKKLFGEYRQKKRNEENN